DRSWPSPTMLHLFRGPNGTPLATYADTPRHSGFALSADGRLLGRQVEDGRVEVVESGGNPVPVARTFAGQFSARTFLLLGNDWLEIRTGKWHCHQVLWGDGELQVRYVRARTRNRAGKHTWRHEYEAEEEPLPCVATREGVPEWVSGNRQR